MDGLLKSSRFVTRRVSRLRESTDEDTDDDAHSDEDGSSELDGDHQAFCRQDTSTSSPNSFPNSFHKFQFPQLHLVEAWEHCWKGQRYRQRIHLELLSKLSRMQLTGVGFTVSHISSWINGVYGATKMMKLHWCLAIRLDGLYYFLRIRP